MIIFLMLILWDHYKDSINKIRKTGRIISCTRKGLRFQCKEINTYRKNGIVTEKYLLCSCKGQTEQRKEGTELILHSPSKDDLTRKMKKN